MSQSLIRQAYAQSYAAVMAAYNAGRKLTPWSPGYSPVLSLPVATTCCFEGAER